MELSKLMKEFWRSLSGVRPAHPTDRVRFNLAVSEEAQYLAVRLKKETPAFNEAVLAEAGRLLDLPRIVELRKVA